MMFDFMEIALSDKKENAMTDTKKNFRHSYTEYETIEEARKHAQRDTARELRTQNIWQRIEETVVPDVDIVINPVDVKTTPVK